MTDTGKGQRLYSQQSAKTTTRRDAKGRPTQTSTQRSNTASRTLPAKSQQQRKEVKKYSSNTNLRSAPKKPAAPASKTTKTTTTKTTTTRTTTITTGSGKPTTVTSCLVNNNSFCRT